MSSLKYIGLDVHLATISIAVLNASGKLIMEVTIKNQATALLDFLRGLRGALHVALEEGTYAEWLYSLLAPRVTRIVVCDPRQNPRRRGEKKSDRLDARKLAEWLRLGTLKPVYHGRPQGHALRELARSYRTLVSDATRVMNRLKALYRGRGIPCAGARVYAPRFRPQWLEQLWEAGVRQRAELLYQQLDLLLALRRQARGAMLAESRRYAAQKILRSIPSLGPVRAALLMAWLGTPHRFRGKRQLWTYAGLALVTRSSAGVTRDLCSFRAVCASSSKAPTCCPICPNQTGSAILCVRMRRLEQATKEILNLEAHFQLPRGEAFRDHDFSNELGTDSLR